MTEGNILMVMIVVGLTVMIGRYALAEGRRIERNKHNKNGR